MYELSNHFRERYAERVQGITDIQTIKSWSYQNADMIIEWANKMVEFGTVFYEGTVNNKYVERRYIRNGEYILVQSPQDGKLITIFKISFTFSDDNNKEISRLLSTEISELQSAIMESQSKFTDINAEINTQIELIDLDIAQLKRKIEILEDSKSELVNQGKKSKYEIKDMNDKLEQLCIRMLGKGFGEELKKG